MFAYLASYSSFIVHTWPLSQDENTWNWQVPKLFVKQGEYCAENRDGIAAMSLTGEKFCLPSS